MSPKALDSCGTCRFWIALPGHFWGTSAPQPGEPPPLHTGLCRRRSPQRQWHTIVRPPHGPQRTLDSRWPPADADDWCGEHSNEASMADAMHHQRELLAAMTTGGKTEAEFEEDQR